MKAEDIKTVKVQGDGYLVNNDLYVPKADGNRHYEAIKEWLKTNTPEPEFTLDELKSKKTQELEVDYKKANTQDISYMNTLFQADKKSQNLIAQNLSIGSVPANFYWKDKNNNKVPMTFAELQGLGSAIQARGMINFDKLSNLKEQVALATSQADLDAIQW